MSASGPDRVLDELLLDWEDSLKSGAPLSAAELCRDCPELAGALEHRIARLQTVDRLLFSTDRADPGRPDKGANGHAGVSLSYGLSGYELIGEIGRGGMGVVFKARQKSLGRFVAVKTLAGSRWLQPGSTARLRQEGQALSRLNHPHVVQVLDVLETEHALSIVLEYVEGGSLAQRLNGSPLPAREAAQLALTLARALTAVHAQGLLHRDIKPGNVLLGRAGEIKISDFGLAKETGDAEGLTMTGELLGSPRYMSPEQAAGRTNEIDVRTDVYGLGATLYEMLTGRAPFQAASHTETLRQVIESEPVSPRLLNPDVPRDLETICLRCLDKTPARRFGSAGELAEELERYRAGEPIRSRPIGAVQRLARWCRRRPAVAALVVVSAAAALVIGAGLFLHARNLTEYNAKLTELNDDLTRLNDELTESSAAARESQHRAEEEESRTKDSLYAADINRAAASVHESDTRAVTELLDRHVPKPDERDRRGFEWWYLRREADLSHRVLLDAGSLLYILCFSPDRRILAVAGQDAVVRLIDPEYGELAREIVTGQVEVNGLAFSPDGRELATAGDDGSIRLWNLQAGTQRLKIAAHPEKAFQVLFSPDGKQLVSCGDNPVIRVHDANSGDELSRLAGHRRTVESIAFCEDGKLLASCSADGSARSWDLASGEPRTVFARDVGVAAVAIAEKRNLLVTGGTDGCVQTWSLSDGRGISSVYQLDGLQSLAVHPDGTFLAAGDASGSIRLWAIDADGRLASPHLRSWQAHRRNARALVWSADGLHLFSTGDDGRVVSWRIARGKHKSGPDILPVGHRSSFSLIHGTNSLITDRPLIRWDWKTGRQEIALSQSPDFEEISTSPDGRLVALGHAGRLSVHRLPDVFSKGLNETAILDRKTDAQASVESVVFSPDSRIIATAGVEEVGGQRAWQVWLLDSQGPFKSERLPVAGSMIAFSPDGTRLALEMDPSIALWDISGRSLVWKQPQANIWSVAFSPDGRLLAIGESERGVVVRNVQDGTVRQRFVGHRSRVNSVVFSPDGRTLASGSNDGAIKLWHIPTGRELFELRAPGAGGCLRLEFTSDGRHLLALVHHGPDGEVILTYPASDEQQMMKCAALLHPRESHAGYFFRGDRYQRFNFDVDRVDKDQQRIGVDGWFGVWTTGIDAALVHPLKPHLAYFFRGDCYQRYNFDLDRVDEDNARIGIDGWQGVWTSGIDAAVPHPLERHLAYFFRGDRYQRFNFELNRIDEDNARVGIDGWQGVWRNGIECAILNPLKPSMAYFFRGDRYQRYDFRLNRTDFDDAIMSSGWPGVWRSR